MTVEEFVSFSAGSFVFARILGPSHGSPKFLYGIYEGVDSAGRVILRTGVESRHMLGPVLIRSVAVLSAETCIKHFNQLEIRCHKRLARRRGPLSEPSVKFRQTLDVVLGDKPRLRKLVASGDPFECQTMWCGLFGDMNKLCGAGHIETQYRMGHYGPSNASAIVNQEEMEELRGEMMPCGSKM